MRILVKANFPRAEKVKPLTNASWKKCKNETLLEKLKIILYSEKRKNKTTKPN